MTEEAAGKLRVDKWLWYARFFKTRTLAAEVANGGKIRVNKVAVRKASADVKVGDVLTFHQGHNIRVIEILGLGSARRPFEEAKLLYMSSSRAGAELNTRWPSKADFAVRQRVNERGAYKASIWHESIHPTTQLGQCFQ